MAEARLAPAAPVEADRADTADGAVPREAKQSVREHREPAGTERLNLFL